MKQFTLIIILFSVVFVTACLNSKTTTNTSEPVSEKTSGSQTPSDKASKNEAPDTGVCLNDYYPVDAAVEREFKVTGDAPGKYVLTHETGSGDTFTEIRKFASGLEVRVNWICTKEGLRTAEYKNSASLSNANFKMDTIESSGLTLPKEWSKGKTWSAEYKISAAISAGPASGSANGTVKIDNKIVSMNDNVSVDGKDYEAVRVDSILKMDLRMKGNKIPSQDLKMTNWYSKNNGLVKQSADTQFGKTGIELIGVK